QADQPGIEARQAGQRVAGGEGVVAENRLGQADVAEDVPEDGLDGGEGLVGAGAQGQQVAAVVVEDRQRHAPAPLDLPRALEVELPELVGGLALEALGRRGVGPRRAGDPTVAAEDGRDGPRRRRGAALGLEEGVELARPPAVAVAGLQHDGLAVLGRAAGGATGSARPVDQRPGRVGVEASQPLVGGLAADAEAAGRVGDAQAGGAGGMDEGGSLLGHGVDLPGHGAPPLGGQPTRWGVTHVPAQPVTDVPAPHTRPPWTVASCPRAARPGSGPSPTPRPGSPPSSPGPTATPPGPSPTSGWRPPAGTRTPWPPTCTPP